MVREGGISRRVEWRTKAGLFSELDTHHFVAGTQQQRDAHIDTHSTLREDAMHDLMGMLHPFALPGQKQPQRKQYIFRSLTTACCPRHPWHWSLHLHSGADTCIKQRCSFSYNTRQETVTFPTPPDYSSFCSEAHLHIYEHMNKCKNPVLFPWSKKWELYSPSLLDHEGGIMREGSTPLVGPRETDGV